MSTHEPAPVAILAARIMRAYPSLSPYSAASLATELSAIERAQRRHAERCCSGEDGGYVMRASGVHLARRSRTGTVIVHDPDAEQRAGQRIAQQAVNWNVRLHELLGGGPLVVNNCPKIELQGDPRGPVLLVRLPGEAEAVAV